MQRRTQRCKRRKVIKFISVLTFEHVTVNEQVLLQEFVFCTFLVNADFTFSNFVMPS